ncbi:hypothetical protein [Streptomyces sp. CoT10]|uniref:hypothetical protein n=1 Tax=Streptomyces sp. CoT10 TaxID=2875762 RepID=UPI001CD612C7|nr:hypothetical protein [Streptomyces sp. CoT10]
MSAPGEARDAVLRALRKKPEGLTSSELRVQTRLGWDAMDDVLAALHDDGLVGLDVSSRGPGRWVASAAH